MFLRLFGSLLIGLFLFSTNLSGQLKGLSSFEPNQMMQQSLQNSIQSNQLLRSEPFPVGNVVVPEHYMIGPDDILSIQIIPSLPSENLLMVSPENIIMIPRVGEVDLTGLNLAQARTKVYELIKRTNPGAIPALTLKQARTVLVTVKGNVMMPGNYFLPASYNISTVLRMADNLRIGSQINQNQTAALLRIQDRKNEKEKFYSESGLPSNIVYARRNIYVLHTDGSSVIADLEKAKVLSDYSNDPCIREGDEIFVPFDHDIDFPTISISGAIRRPVSIVYKEGDKLSMLLKMGMGLLFNADLDNIYLTEPTGLKEKIRVDKDNNLISEDIGLQPGSSVIVGEKKNINLTRSYTVSIQGNVSKPGSYSISPGVSRLKDMIDQAGGFTDNAYLPLAHIIRRDDYYLSATNYQRDILEHFQYSDLLLEDTTRYILHMNFKRPYVSCDFENLFVNGNQQDNVVLQDGDVIIVPSNPGRVYVFGQVNNPGYVEFSESKSIEWYVDRAGGYGPDAEEDRVRIIRGKTLVWIEDDDSVFVRSGDMVYVPRPPDVPKSVQAQNYSVIAAIISSSAVLLSVVIGIFSK